MLDFCDATSSLSHPWVKNGFSPCFFNTTTSALLFAVMCVFGGTQIAIYRKYASPLDPRSVPRVSCLYVLQILLTVSLAVEAVVGLVLAVTGVSASGLCVSGILQCVFTALAWGISLLVIHLERHRMLPSVPTRGHGLVLIGFWALAFIVQNAAFVSWFSPLWWWRDRDSHGKSVELGLWCWRYVGSALLFILGFVAPGLSKTNVHQLSVRADEEQPLTGPDHEASGAGSGNQRPPAGGSTWRGVWKKSMMLWPYMWPKQSFLLQLCVITCVLLLAAGRVVNLFTPILYKLIVDSLTPHNASAFAEGAGAGEASGRVAVVGGLEFRWDYILIYSLLRFLQGGGFGSMGLLNNLRGFLWIWIQQFSTREIEVQLFSHLHGLSLRWHLGRKTGEVLRVMDRGTNSINNLLNYIVFNILPTIADIVIAIIYFLTVFSAWFALIVFITMALYLGVTIGLTEWRTKYRRDMNILDNARNARAVDSLLNFETVKYYGAESFEVEKYREAILKYQKAEWTSTASLNLLNSMQNIVISAGLLSGSLLCAWYVYDHSGLTVGDYVLFATYIIQLYAPLNWFGTYYRMIQQSFIDMENMFDLLEEKQEVKDTSEAVALTVTKGRIEFDQVTFYYDPSKPILKDLSFMVPPGHTFALVGTSGAGKSTIVRLLFRFYDVQGGAIRIDGQDIAQVTQESLRRAIGVVPQDTVLFNNDIRYNIRYGRVTASDEDVEQAARAADIHDRILTFPDKYETKVGERGLKLSGGEKQRVAIARTILKAPDFVLLDEATSALDTQTERTIQASLAEVCEDRTTLVVAHRLSTIINAHQILVLHQGVICERGTHEELLEQGGRYADMWQQQLTKADEPDTSSPATNPAAADPALVEL